MMKIIMYMIFMTPLMVSNITFIYTQFMYLFIYTLFLILCPPCSFFSCISYYLGVDYYSYGLMIMSIIICSLMKISMMGCSYKKSYKFINLSLMIFMFFIFLSMSFLFMYISFEFVLLPLMILIFGWGYQPERLISGLYLFFYTLLTSFPLFVMILKIYSKNGSFFFDYLMMMDCNFVMYFFMLFALLVKFPMFMFHFWLPLAHVQAPVSGSMILAGLMLKIGGYGLIRMMFMYEYMYMYNSYIWFSISLVGSFMMGLLCLIQGDMKCLVAYSSICHMGMCIMGLMTMKTMGFMGSYFLMLGHGFCSSGLFYMVNMIYMRTSSRSFFVNSGMFMYMPSCSMFFFILCCFNMSCPPSLNFISELMILFSMMCYWGSSYIFFFVISFICACFSYYLYSYSHHGVFHNLYSFSSASTLENLCVLMHLIPLVGLCLVLMN